MTFLNQVLFVGNLGKDPELIKEGKSGSFVRLSIATTKTFKAKGETKQKTQWHKVYLNNSLGKSALAHYKKGLKLYIRGELETHSWKDKEGKKCFDTAVFAIECKPFFKPNAKEAALQEEQPSADTVAE